MKIRVEFDVEAMEAFNPKNIEAFDVNSMGELSGTVGRFDVDKRFLLVGIEFPSGVVEHAFTYML